MVISRHLSSAMPGLPPRSKPRMTAEWLRHRGIHEGDVLGDERLAGWIRQASRLPGEHL